MESPFVLITAVVELFSGIFALLLLAIVWRGMKSRACWSRTRGRIKKFGVSGGAPSVVYDYEVDGTKLTGQAIVPGPISCKYAGQTTLPKAVYLHSDGSLKFPPDADVDVYYDPQKPADAVLVPGVQMGIWKGFAVVLLFALSPFIFSTYQSWFKQHTIVLFASVFFFAGVFLFYYGVRLLNHCLQTRNCPFVTGRLLNAEVVYSSSGDSGGYAPSVEFEYAVDGKLYQSRQLTAIPVQVLTSQKKAQAQVDQLRSKPDIAVYYDPHLPWEGFLRPGPYWGPALPMLMGIAFAGVGLAVFLFAKQ